MLDFESLSSGKPVPAVDAGDMKRVYELISGAPRSKSAAPGAVGWDTSLIANQCSQGAEPVVVFFRVAILKSLFDSGSLDEWRDRDRPSDVMFQTMATFPLPNGIQSFRPDEFASALRKAS